MPVNITIPVTAVGGNYHFYSLVDGSWVPVAPAGVAELGPEAGGLMAYGEFDETPDNLVVLAEN
jgi:hypothetical protein